MRAFIIRGFGKKRDSSGVEVDFDKVQGELIEPAMKACGLSGGTTATEEDSGNIREDIFALILEADVVICDITVHNANVFYELGIRHALRKKHTVLIRGQGSADTTPFDLSTDRYLAYDIINPGSAVARLTATLKATLLSDRDTDSPIFLLLPSLTEADPSEVIVVPLDLVQFDAGKAYAVQEILWSSPLERHDCALLRVAEPVAGIAPLPLARVLPLLEPTAHVYVIGYPGGRNLAFSLQDNALLDHEGPPAGKPAIVGVCRVHYRAPTEGGSSGSPVFNANLSEVIALHHSGGKLGMPKLNGQPGAYAANEGMAIQSIVANMKS